MPSKIVRSSRTPGGNGNGSGNGFDGHLDEHAPAEVINAEYGDTPLPEGYALASSFGETWNPFTKRSLIGHVDDVGVTLLETPDPNSKIKGATRWSQKVTIIADDDGKSYDVWESASLKKWF